MDVLNQKRMQQIKDHLWGPTGSVILHIIIVILLIQFLVFTAREEDAEIEVDLVEMEVVELEELEQVLEEVEEVEEVIEDIAPPTEVITEAPPDPTDVNTPQPEMDFTALEVANFESPLVLKGLYAGRSSAGRAAMLGRYGGRWGGKSEAAVVRALAWLRDNQLPDGSWPECKYAMTGLALLTFLAHGETPQSKEFGECVEKGIRYLVNNQPADGWWKACGGGGAYAHAIATYGIAEAYTMTRIPSLKPALDKATKVLVDGQSKQGWLWNYGWNYTGGETSGRQDMSVSGWCCQALKAAKMAGASVDGLQNAIDQAVAAIKKSQASNGRFPYSAKNFEWADRGSPVMTAVGALSLQLLGHGRASQTKAAIQSMADMVCNWDEANGHRSMYMWYYATQAKFHEGGQTWTEWNNQFAPEFIANQEEDGHWEFPGNPGEGHGDREGPVYSTTLAALSLMVYYRHLPSYKEVDHVANPDAMLPGQPPKEGEDILQQEDDVVIDII